MGFVKVRLFRVLLCLLVFGLSATVASAQARELTVGQPAFVDISDESPSVDFAYNLTQFSRVTIQAISETAQPTITIVSETGDIAAEQSNAGGALAVDLTALLSPGPYTVRLGSLNKSSGSVIVLVQRETPVPVEALLAGVGVSASVTPEEPALVYSFEALDEPAYLYVESLSDSSGVMIRLLNITDGGVSALVDAALLGTRLTIPASASTYQLQVSHGGDSDQTESFELCLTPRSAGGCEGAAPVVQPPPAETGCFVTPTTAAGANMRQTADAAAPVLLVLPFESAANVIGISPDGNAYQVTYANLTGWIAAVAVTANGNCGAVTVVVPPPVQVAATQPPAPPPPPPPSPVPTNTPSGPCLITITSPTFIYVVPIADISHLQDQLGAGSEMIPIGRLADNTWWHTNYGGAWIETIHFGVSATVTGDCSGLPVVPAP